MHQGLRCAGGKQYSSGSNSTASTNRRQRKVRTPPPAYDTRSSGLMLKHLYGHLPVQLDVDAINSERLPAGVGGFKRSLQQELLDQFDRFLKL